MASKAIRRTDQGLELEGGDQDDPESPADLPGFRFHPTDAELVGFYLRRKVEKKPLRIDVIKQVDIYKYDPSDLPKVVGGGGGGGEAEWYFFCPRVKKYPNSVRPNRVTRTGFWKATGIDKPVHSRGGGGGTVIGLKKSLVYYRGSSGKGAKTDWMMHELRLSTSSEDDDHSGPAEAAPTAQVTWTVCRVFKRTNASNHKIHGQASWKVDGPDQVTTTAAENASPADSCSTDPDYSAADHAERDRRSEEDKAANDINGGGGGETTQSRGRGVLQNCWSSPSSSSSPHENFSWAPDAAIDTSWDANYWDELGTLMEFAGDPFFPYGFM